MITEKKSNAFLPNPGWLPGEDSLSIFNFLFLLCHAFLCIFYQWPFLYFESSVLMFDFLASCVGEGREKEGEHISWIVPRPIMEVLLTQWHMILMPSWADFFFLFNVGNYFWLNMHFDEISRTWIFSLVFLFQEKKDTAYCAGRHSLAPNWIWGGRSGVGERITAKLQSLLVLWEIEFHLLSLAFTYVFLLITAFLSGLTE